MKHRRNNEDISGHRNTGFKWTPALREWERERQTDTCTKTYRYNKSFCQWNFILTDDDLDRHTHTLVIPILFSAFLSIPYSSFIIAFILSFMANIWEETKIRTSTRYLFLKKIQEINLNNKINPIYLKVYTHTHTHSHSSDPKEIEIRKIIQGKSVVMIKKKNCKSFQINKSSILNGSECKE